MDMPSLQASLHDNSIRSPFAYSTHMPVLVVQLHVLQSLHYQLRVACMLNGAWLHGTCTVQPQRGAIQVRGTLCVANGIDSCGWFMPHDLCVPSCQE